MKVIKITSFAILLVALCVFGASPLFAAPAISVEILAEFSPDSGNGAPGSNSQGTLYFTSYTATATGLDPDWGATNVGGYKITLIPFATNLDGVDDATIVGTSNPLQCTIDQIEPGTHPILKDTGEAQWVFATYNYNYDTGDPIKYDGVSVQPNSVSSYVLAIVNGEAVPYYDVPTTVTAKINTVTLSVEGGDEVPELPPQAVIPLLGLLGGAMIWMRKRFKK